MSDPDIYVSGLPVTRETESESSPTESSGGEVDPDEMYGAIVDYVRSAFDPPEQAEARKWWDYFPQFVEAVEGLEERSEIESDEAEALMRVYLSQMIEATVNEQFRGVLGGSFGEIQTQLWTDLPRRSTSTYSVWSHEFLTSE